MASIPTLTPTMTLTPSLSMLEPSPNSSEPSPSLSGGTGGGGVKRRRVGDGGSKIDLYKQRSLAVAANMAAGAKALEEYIEKLESYSVLEARAEGRAEGKAREIELMKEGEEL